MFCNVLALVIEVVRYSGTSFINRFDIVKYSKKSISHESDNDSTFFLNLLNTTREHVPCELCNTVIVVDRIRAKTLTPALYK